MFARFSGKEKAGSLRGKPADALLDSETRLQELSHWAAWI